MRNGWLILGVFGVALVVNPYLACSSRSDEVTGGSSAFEYGEEEFKLAVLGTWEGTAEIDGVTTPFSLSLEQSNYGTKTQSIAGPQLRPQCTSRSFVKPAGACVSLSSMPVTGSMSSENPQLNGALDGDVMAFSKLDSIDLELRLESGFGLYGQIKDQAVSDGSISEKERKGTFSLSRP